MKKIILLLTFIAFLSKVNAQIYVDRSATGGSNNGTSWTNAYKHLQDAIDAAAPNDEIWVAAGTYYPTASPDGTTTDPRDKAFHLHTDMKIYGGFAGTDTLLSQRDWTTNITILSGDIDNATDPDVVTGSDSTLSITGNTGNAYHVMITANLTDSTFIDGFTIKGGNANAAYVNIIYRSKTFFNYFGGGMYNISSSPTITNSTFTNNNVVVNGGGMSNSYSSPTITNSTFTNNNAAYGGGMSNSYSSPTITNSTFTNNNAAYGGGMFNISSSPTITNSTFANNYASSGGDGMINTNDCSPVITNTIIWNNGNNEVFSSNSTPIFKNSIIKSSNGSGGSWNADYGTDNGENLDIDPLFVDAANGDYTLQRCSPALNTGTIDTTGLNIGLIDLAGNARVFGGRIDMGAYEYQGASCDGMAIYVNKAAVGDNDGSSWTNAYTGLQDAIDNQFDSLAIWVAAGTYYPTKDHTGDTSPTDNRDKNFHLHTDMKIYGGFDGTETLLSARDILANSTILSGDFGNNDVGTIESRNENVYHVMITANLTSAAVIDGFTIKGGNAYGNYGSEITYQSKTFKKRYGGGMTNKNSSPTITNSTFANNGAKIDGGGMYNYNYSSPTITNSTFTNNFVDIFDGGIYIGRSGGGMYNYNYSSPTITNSTFTNNDAQQGGGMYNNNFSSPTIKNSAFTNNTGITSENNTRRINEGGGMYNNNHSSPTITNSTFTKNVANSGGGMFNSFSSPTITNSTFRYNIANNGGGMYNGTDAPAKITNSTFTQNTATYGGGGMYTTSSSPTITNSTFTKNVANNGGGMYNERDEVSPTITNSTFTDNIATSNGGGMLNDVCSPTITNSTFTENSADNGGGMYNERASSPTITNSTFTNNKANRDGGGMNNYDSSSPTITNSIIWDNGSNEVANDSSSTPTFKNSIIKGSGGSNAWNTVYGTDNGENLDIDPLFVDAANGDFNLQCYSPAINNGILAGAPTKDMTGFTRVGNPDMGAYEYVESAPLIITGSIANGTNPTYEGSPSITTEWPILNTNNAVFKARKFIELKPGFLVSPAAGAATVFRAEIGGGCPE